MLCVVVIAVEVMVGVVSEGNEELVEVSGVR